MFQIYFSDYSIIFLLQVEAKRLGAKLEEDTISSDSKQNVNNDGDGLSDVRNNDTLSALRWKGACVRILRLRRHLKNGMCFKTTTVRDIAGSNVDIAAIDYDNGHVAVATSRCK